MLGTGGSDSAGMFFNSPGNFPDTKSLLDVLCKLAYDASNANFHGKVLISMNCRWKGDCNDDICWGKRAQEVSQDTPFLGTLDCQRLLEPDGIVFDASRTCKQLILDSSKGALCCLGEVAMQKVCKWKLIHPISIYGGFRKEGPFIDLGRSSLASLTLFHDWLFHGHHALKYQLNAL